MPFVLFKTILDLDPNHENPTLRAIARIWKREAIVPAGSGNAAASGRSITSASARIRPTTSTAWRVRSASASRRCRSDSPSRTRAAFEPLSAAETTVYDGRLLARRVFQNTSLLIAKLRTADNEENWERDRPGFGSPGAMDRVFFSCAACHVGRVMVSGKMKFLPGNAEHRNRGAVPTRSC